MLLYLATPTRHYTFDAVAYAYQIDRFEDDGRPNWLFHAHHLLFNAVGWVLMVLLRELGIRLSSLEALQALNSVLGGVGVGLFALVLARATRRPLLAVGMALLLGVSHGYWTCATDGRVNLPGLVLVIGAFGAALRWVESGSPAWARGSAALTGLAILFHQSHVLFVPTLAAAALLSPVPWRRKIGAGLAAAAVLAAIVGAVYLTAAVAEGIRDLEGLLTWLWGYGADGRWWSLDWRANLPLSASALLRALWMDGLTGRAGLPPGIFHQEAGVTLSMLLIGAFLLAWRLPSLMRRHGAAVLLCATWFVTYAAFFNIWNPGYFVFWVPQLTAALFGAGLILAGLLPAPQTTISPRGSTLAGMRAWSSPPRPPLGAQGAMGGSLRSPPGAPRREGGSLRSLPPSSRRPAQARAVRVPHAQVLRAAAHLQARRPRLNAVPKGPLRVAHRFIAGKDGGYMAPVPEGRLKIAQRFIAGTRGGYFHLVPEGRLNLTRRFITGSQLASHAWRLASAATVTAFIFAAVPILFFHSYRAAIRPRMEASTNANLRLAEAVRRATQPGDLVLVTGTGWLALGEVYIPYFSRRPMLALQAVLKQEHGDKEAAFRRLRDEMERCWARGGQVYLLSEVLASRAAYSVLAQRYGVQQSDAIRFFEPYAPRPSLQAGAHSVWRLSRPLIDGRGNIHAQRGPEGERVAGSRQPQAAKPAGAALGGSERRARAPEMPARAG
jgi:hypothetical protein